MAKKIQPAPEAYVDPWRAEDDARTLHKAEQIRADKERMKHVTNHVNNLSKVVQKPKVKKPTAPKPATKKK